MSFTNLKFTMTTVFLQINWFLKKIQYITVPIVSQYIVIVSRYRYVLYRQRNHSQSHSHLWSIRVNNWPNPACFCIVIISENTTKKTDIKPSHLHAVRQEQQPTPPPCGPNPQILNLNFNTWLIFFFFCHCHRRLFCVVRLYLDLSLIIPDCMCTQR